MYNASPIVFWFGADSVRSVSPKSTVVASPLFERMKNLLSLVGTAFASFVRKKRFLVWNDLGMTFLNGNYI